MKLKMSHIVPGLAGIAMVCSIIMLSQHEPAEAVLEGSNRSRMEFLNFSETMIKDGLYAKTGKETFNRKRKKYVRGIRRHNEPRIYEPDVYTWELALQEHRKKISGLKEVEENVKSGNVTPVPMEMETIIPTNPETNVVPAPLGGSSFMGNCPAACEALPDIPALMPAAVYNTPVGTKGDSCDASF